MTAPGSSPQRKDMDMKDFGAGDTGHDARLLAHIAAKADDVPSAQTFVGIANFARLLVHELSLQTLLVVAAEAGLRAVAEGNDVAAEDLLASITIEARRRMDDAKRWKTLAEVVG